MKSFSFQGMWTALVTPFLPDGQIDWLSLDQLIDYQLNAGVTGFVACGSTAESPTLTDHEQEAVIVHVIDRVKGKVPVIVGAGTNNTPSTLQKARKAIELGADALMLVVPYYNRPTQRGMIAHFGAIAEEVHAPIIIYNAPARCGVEITPSTMKSLHGAYPHIQAIKDCGGSVDKLFQLVYEVGPNFEVLTGDDNWILAAMSLGAKGVISAGSNVMAKDFVNLVQALLDKDMEAGLNIFKRCYPLIQKAFIETNPIAIKYLLFKMGIITADSVRSPLVALDPLLRDSVESTLRQYQFSA